jgi:DNA-binding CsgD family transcriptional regulator
MCGRIYEKRRVDSRTEIAAKYMRQETRGRRAIQHLS